MDFDLLIPAEDCPIEERTHALTAWCTGFLYGLGSNGAADPQRLPGDLGEIVRDLTEITRAGVDASDSLEANESALAELVEFVRVGRAAGIRRARAAARASTPCPDQCCTSRAALDSSRLIFSSTRGSSWPIQLGVEFARRRTQLMRLMGTDAIAILPAAPVRQRNNDVEYDYRQDSDFYYLTRLSGAGVGRGADPGPRSRANMCCSCASATPSARSGTASAPGPPGRSTEYGADDAFPIGDIDEILPGLLEGRARVFYTMGLNQEFDQRVIGWVNTLRAQARSGMHPPQEFVALDHRAARHAPLQEPRRARR